jgi:AraC-like DNA-binding protein
MHYADMEHTPSFVSVLLQVRGLDLSLMTGRIIAPDNTVIDLLASAMEEAQRPDAHSESMILNLLELVLYRLLRAHRGMMPAEKPTAENRIIRRAQQCIDAHVCEKLSVPTVAQMTGVSPSYLTALFHKHLHFSPGEYIRIIKLQKSKQLIREGKMNFTEIADFLSYSTVHHFSRQFKENFGISPTEYVKSLAKSAPHS